MKVVYIAGPYRGANSWEVELNIRAAERLAFRVAELGGVPLCPHSMFRHFNGTQTDRFWLEGTAELLRRSDAILMAERWEASGGSVSEKAIAGFEMKVPIFFEADGLHDVEAWLNE